MTAVYPQPEEVKACVVFGPNGDDYTGTYAPGDRFDYWRLWRFGNNTIRRREPIGEI